MQYTIWHDGTVVGTVDLPNGSFVASRLKPSVGYLTCR